MSHFIAACLGLLLILAGSCAVEPAAPKGPWSVKLTTSGGFAGVGRGTIAVDSDGKFEYSEPTSPQQVRKGCKGTIYPRRLQPISEAVAQAQPQEWNRPDLNVAAPDAFGYKLELRIGADGQPTVVQWYDNTKDRLPADLKHLSDVLIEVMKPDCFAGQP